jgi:hypothetical protein
MKLNKSEMRIYRELSFNCKKSLNSINVPKNQGEKHFLAICRLCYYFVNNGENIVTEAKLPKSRPDILNLSREVAYEVLNTEKQKNIELKKEYYTYPIVPLTADEILSTEELEKIL